jgi:hypothetical protein
MDVGQALLAFSTRSECLAAGVLYPFFGLLLSPMIAAAAMSLSRLRHRQRAAAPQSRSLRRGTWERCRGLQAVTFDASVPVGC